MVVPFLGKIIAGNQQAYNYLSDSAEQFPHGKDFKEILEMNGFTDVTIIKLNLGIVNIYEATK